ncbi:hypothetical protein CAPTEDRAFT_188595 [Capitella teleta]|uniref:SWIM-type domain-containing protein n=1 Tax=Capitella teleta TaxID=283909 RepID=R7VB71_CAPTE|nr:hypothetical protein CAPTEDRAFT_188595 [Capitella teleta]|eukprot:ELU15782.1 hypothetical protein CAPTEDRAFT_188595 [Capitella teleta]
MSSNLQVRHNDFDATCKSHYRNGYSGPGTEYYSVATAYAVDKVLPQVESADPDKYEIQQQGSCFQTRNKKTGDTYIVTSDCMKCSCSFHQTMLLPCRHIFVNRMTLSLPIFDPQLVASRWLLSSIDADAVPQMQKATRLQLGSVDMKIDGPMSHTQKFNMAMTISSKLADVVADSGQATFQTRMTFLARVLAMYEAGKECVLIEEEDDPPEINIVIGGEEENEQRHKVSLGEADDEAVTEQMLLGGTSHLLSRPAF